MQLPLNELFETVQGEGSMTGTPSTFVRLQGCDVGCPWCDTKHTWTMDEPVHLEDVLAKTISDARYAMVDTDELALRICQRCSHHVVLTGGEPCQYDLTELAFRLLGSGRSVQIETSGTEPVRAPPPVFVTLSPKLDMPGGRSIVPDTLDRANEIKMPVGKMADVEKLDLLLNHRTSPWRARDVWLQPLSESAKATELCRQVAAERGWRVSLQMHKQANIR
jgi:7-carboxy-7-deazaguanine synthase